MTTIKSCNICEGCALNRLKPHPTNSKNCRYFKKLEMKPTKQARKEREEVSKITPSLVILICIIFIPISYIISVIIYGITNLEFMFVAIGMQIGFSIVFCLIYVYQNRIREYLLKNSLSKEARG